MNTSAQSKPPGMIRRLVTRIAAPFATREREVRDTLWLLLTAIWIVMPHYSILPVWASIASAALLAWRGWITWTGHRLPRRWILTVLMLAAGIAVYVQFRTIFGKDAGVAYLVLLLGLKLLEMRARRDIFVVTFLCLFVLLTSFFESQSILTAAHMMVALLLLVTSLVSTNFGEREPSYFTKLKIAGSLCLIAAPLMVVLFVLFPRVQGPLWGMPADAYAGLTGLSESMSPGTIANLSESNEIAFRAAFEGPPPPQSERYWRGPVLGSFNGRTWRPLFTQFIQNNRDRQAPRSGPPDLVADQTSLIEYTVTLEPHNQPWLFMLEAPKEAPSLSNTGTQVRLDLQVVARTLVRERMRYTAKSYTRFQYGRDEQVAIRRAWTALPQGFNPRTIQYASTLRDAAAKPVDDSDAALAVVNRQLIERVLQTFRSENFFYTLQPPLLGRDSVDEFLFDTRRGFCEHYASAFVVLMRALDIPARVVTGYQGGELNPVNQFVEVRQRDAHAWAEVWLADAGWVRVDPTAAVAPARVEQGVNQALPAAQGFANTMLANANWLRYVRFNWDAITNTWNQWVLSFNTERQRGLFEDLGVPDVDWRKLMIALVLVFGAALALIGAALVVRRPRLDPVVALYLKFSERNARLGLGREAHEGPQAYLARILPDLPASVHEQAREITRLYEHLRYAPPASRPSNTFLRFKTCVQAFRV